MTTDPPSARRAADSEHRRSFRHWGGFLASGGTAAVVDAAITLALVHLAGFDPFTSRLIAILIAMVVAWLMHRRLTFAVAAAPSLREFLRFAAVAWSANALNYAIYAGILLAWPGSLPLVAIVIATGIAAVFSYIGFRFGVFREPPPVA
jgi:putative flippase GtrA